MDRRQFILAKNFEGNENSCGELDCICDEPAATAGKGSLRWTHLSLLTFTAFVLAAVLVFIQSSRAYAALLQDVKRNSIACRPGEKNKAATAHDEPSENNNGHGCSHQLTSLALCNHQSLKRKKQLAC